MNSGSCFSQSSSQCLPPIWQYSFAAPPAAMTLLAVVLHDLYEQQGLSDEEINELIVLDVKDQEYFSQRGHSDQHGGGMAFAKDPAIMGWLFGH